MIKLIFLALLCMNSSQASEPLRPTVDFADTKPRTKHMFSIDMSFRGDWKADGTYSKFCACIRDVTELLEKNNLGTFQFAHETSSESICDRDVILGDHDGTGKLKHCLFIHFEYAVRSRSLHLLPRECSIFKDPNPICMVLSWNYINNALKVLQPRVAEDDELHQMIKEKGLKNSFTRLGIMINEDHTFSFYNVFETTEEERRGADILKKMQTIFV